jgi:hypothetical protein
MGTIIMGCPELRQLRQPEITQNNCHIWSKNFSHSAYERSQDCVQVVKKIVKSFHTISLSCGIFFTANVTYRMSISQIMNWALNGHEYMAVFLPADL